MFRWLLLVCVLVAVIAGLLVGVKNPLEVHLDLIFFDVSMPLGALVGVVFFSGIFVAWFAQLVGRLRRLGQRRRH